MWYSSNPIAIKHVFKVSEEDLKTKLKSEGKLCSDVVEINDLRDIRCRIDLHLETKSDENGEEKEMLCVYLSLLRLDDDMEICSKFAFYIKSANFLEYCKGFHKSEEYDSWGDAICSYNDLFNPEKKYIVSGEFVVEMKGIIVVKDLEMKNKMPENSVIERLWNDDDEKDFTIAVGKDNEHKAEIKVHKSILSACSPVFKRMFKTDMKEMREGKVEIIDFDLDTVKLAVAFCYDQDIFEGYRGWQQLIDLHRFADKYDIKDLKHQTEFYLVDVISLEDICEITNAVINLNAPKLRDLCFRFLLIAVTERIPVKDMDILDTVFARDLLKKATSIENC